MLSKWINRSHLWIVVICLIILTTNILLITGYVQIKYSKALKMNNKDTSDEKEILLKENNDLKNAIDSLNADLVKQKQEVAEIEQKYKTAKDNSANILNMYEDVIKGELLRQNGDLIGSATSLKSVNRDYLLNNANKLYGNIKEQTFKSAAEYYYKAGYDDFLNERYDKAIEKLNKSIYFAQDEDFKDDTIYYLGESYYKSGNKEMAKSTAKLLIDNFPDSQYKSEAQNLYAMQN